MSIRIFDMHDAVGAMVSRERGLHLPHILIVPSDHSPSALDVQEFLRETPYTKEVRFDHQITQMWAICNCCSNSFPLEDL